MAIPQHFAATYSLARRSFLAASTQAGAWVESHAHPAERGAEGELLATDVARIGPEDAENLLVVCSGTHGNEGFCGSGCQIGFLAEGLVASRPASVAVLLVHAVNPYGFSHLRRVTEGNVDLNRNFQDFRRPLPDNPAYEELHADLVPDDWDGPARAAADAALEAWMARNGGEAAFQAAVAGGQYRHPDGMFFGGQAPVWAQATFRGIIRRHAALARRVAVIDIHTGLGPTGYGEPISVDAPCTPAFLRSRAWWGDEVRSVHGDASERAASPPVAGPLIGAVHQDAPRAEVTAIALEYGTVRMLDVFDALRGDNWLYARGLPGGLDPGSAMARGIRQKMRDALYVDTDDWKEKVYARAADFAAKAYRGLSAG
jgi:hypothetical protein